MSPKMRGWFYTTYLTFALILIGGWSVLALYWRVWPSSVITFSSGANLDLVNGLTYRRGDILAYRTAGTIHVSGVQGQQSRVLIDGTVTFLSPNSLTTGAVGPFDLTNTSISVPKNLLPGMYRLQLTNVYTLNPLRTETITRTSPVFEVVGP